MKVLGKVKIGQPVKLPLFLDKVAAGFPSPAQDYTEQSLDLNELLIPNPSATYLVKVENEGDSMIELGIFPNDILIVDRSIEPVHGHVVIASVNGDLTCKQLETRPQVRLIAHNPNFEPIVFDELDSLEIFGVVRHNIRNHISNFL